MNRIMIALAGAIVAAPVLAAVPAASPFDGTWVTDLSATKYSAKPRTIAFKDGMYQCDCEPPIRIKADGQFHPVTGHPYVDEMSIKAADGRHATSIRRKGGKSIETDRYTLSPDGGTLSIAFTDTSAPDGKPVTGTTTLKRAAAAPAGTLPLSGGWVKAGETVSQEALVQTLKLDGKVLRFSTPNGFAFDAPLDGKPVPIKGDPAGAMASVRMTGPRTLVETDTVQGKPQSVTTMTVRADGRTMDATVENKLSARTTHYVVRKR